MSLSLCVCFVFSLPGNPWGKFEWCGRWADGSAEWTPAFVKHFGAEISDDGTFYMCFEDWAREFNHLYVLRLYVDDGDAPWTRQKFQGRWTPETAGGCINNATWNRNPQYQIVASRNTPVFISVTLKDKRKDTEPGCPTVYPGHGALLISRPAPSTSKVVVLSKMSEELVYAPAYRALREGTVM